MKNTFGKIVLASAVVAAAAFTAIPAMAASARAATINVPFSFTSHGKSLPAGTYNVRWDSTGNFVTIQNNTAADTFLWNPERTATADQHLIMRFEERGREHALRSIQYGEMTTPQLTKKTGKREDIAVDGATSGL